MHRSVQTILDRLPSTPREYFNERNGRFAWEIQAARASEAGCWGSARRMIKNARAWRQIGDAERAAMCLESARLARRNALAYRREVALIRSGA